MLKKEMTKRLISGRRGFTDGDSGLLNGWCQQNWTTGNGTVNGNGNSNGNSNGNGNGASRTGQQHSWKK